MVKPLFSLFKVNEAINLQPKPITSQEEFLNKINERLKLLETVVPDTPQQSSRTNSRVVNTLEKSNSESNHTDESETDTINQVASQSWKKPSKLFYQRATPPDLPLEEKPLSIKSFSVNNIYEWNIDGQTEY